MERSTYLEKKVEELQMNATKTARVCESSIS